MLFLFRSDACLWSRSLSHPTHLEASKHLKCHPQNIQISPNSDVISPVSLQLVSPEPRLILCLFFASATAMVNVNSIMRRSPADRDMVQLPTASAFNICDGLFKMANCLVVGLPEAQLRGVRYALDTLMAKVDRLLESDEYDLSLNFDGLAIDPGKSSKSHPKLPHRSHIFRHPGGRRLWRTCIFEPRHQRLWTDFDPHCQRWANVSLPLTSTPASEHHQSPRSYDLGPNSSPESSSNLFLDPVPWPVPPHYFQTRERWSTQL